ncbi:ethanolamine ammonia-lyase reactivating factor EutA [uncultured Desulfuromusa sp.]|uniref:ethanolamine ammonia-lyase reactivating factor EutA n=1 Tax=uncultured Desulfuromusa sp. TaxID=219183 RepID=UPI002AA85EB6|nr:ethanolamine ammonia-lyase reactivating factor EutA [uncultured Desulfuromusa sp.]
MKEQILSVGIDIGTTTTQLVFSQLTLENTASLISVPRIEIVGKEVVFRSDIHFTPLRSQQEIDEQKIRELIERDYRSAGMTPDKVQTGAVIITGEAARKQNAESVLKALSGLAGEFVVATAGPTLEGIIAGKGAGASQESKKRGATIVNLDIGGGTTNIAVFRNGEVIDTACLDIGGRLIQFQNSGKEVSYIADKIRSLARTLNVSVTENHSLNQLAIETIARRMAGILEEVLGLTPVSPQLASMLTDHDLKRDYQIDYVSFSGGVADCIQHTNNDEDFRYGDIGGVLGRAIADSKIPQQLKVLQAVETIRATVVGAGSHTTGVSGSTISVSAGVLPMQNIPVLKLSTEDEALPLSQWGEAILRKVQWFNLEGEKQNLALAFSGPENLGFSGVKTLAQEIVKGMQGVLCKTCPLVVIIEKDLGKVLGQTLRNQLEFKKDVICIDTIQVENGDYIDIGRELVDGNVVPVIVKTLVFDY